MLNRISMCDGQDEPHDVCYIFLHTQAHKVTDDPERNMAKDLTTPAISVMVTMSPLAMWLISWASTPSISSFAHAVEEA